VDYRKFLGARQTMVLPYLGGPFVFAPDRRLRVTERVAVGWWRFAVVGRNATAQAPADAPPMSRLSAVRGHLVGDWLFTNTEDPVRLYLMPEEEPEVFSPATGRRWPGGEAVFDSIAFEDEAEAHARAVLLDGDPLGDAKGVAPSLRGAFGYAALVREASARGMTASPREFVHQLHAVADGAVRPEALLDELEARVYQLNPESVHRGLPQAAPLMDPAQRAATILDAAGATFLSARTLGDANLEVVFRYLSEQFIAVVDSVTMHVYDSGICLEGYDELLGLDSLPSVIAEAIDDGALHITRR